MPLSRVPLSDLAPCFEGAAAASRRCGARLVHRGCQAVPLGPEGNLFRINHKLKTRLRTRRC